MFDVLRYYGELLLRSLLSCPGLLSSNWLAALFSVVVATRKFWLDVREQFHALKSWRERGHAMTEKENIRNAIKALAYGCLLLFVISLLKTIYDDHQSLVAANEKLVSQQISPWTGGAKVVWVMKEVSAPTASTPFFINIYEQNQGTRDALGVTHSYAWRVSDRELTKDEEDNGKDVAMAGLRYVPNTELRNRILAGDKLGWFTANDNFLKSDDFDEITKGTKKVYLWGIVHYRDSETPKGKSIFTEFCGYFTKTFSFYHECNGHNGIYVAPSITKKLTEAE